MLCRHVGAGRARMRHLVVLCLASSLLFGCFGPSDEAIDPPPAAPGTASLRVDGRPDIAFTTTPVPCGTPPEFTLDEGEMVCRLLNEDEHGFPDAIIDIFLRHSPLDELPEGTELRTRQELPIVDIRGGDGDRLGRERRLLERPPPDHARSAGHASHGHPRRRLLRRIG